MFCSFLFIFSCKTTVENTEDRNAIIDSTITNFKKKLLSQQADSVFEKYHFNGSIAIFKDSTELYRKDAGYSDFKSKTPIDAHTVFAIGSLSKQFTAVLILLQMEQGKLSLEDKVSQYLPDFQTAEYKNITIHQLLNHTSGLNTLGARLMFKSGSDFFYSNDGYNSLGKIIEKVSGKSYSDNVSELFLKAGMSNSSTGETFNGNNFAGAYLGNTNVHEKIANMPKRLGDKNIGIPAGGILSTIDDLHHWNTSLYNNKIIKPETLHQFITKSSERNHPVFGKMGYGYGIMLNLGQPTTYFHSGYIKGSPSLILYYPNTKTTAIILSNIADENKGLKAVFKPHIEIKKMVEAIDPVATELRKEMIKEQIAN